MNSRFGVIILSCIIAFIAFLTFTKKNNTSTNTQQAGGTSSHVYGTGTKKVNLTEYGDFQCPACGLIYPVIKQLKEKYKDSIVFQFRNFPLVQIHPNAMAAHRAAEAASKQGKFWEMHDILYERQDSWSRSSNPATVMQDFAAQLSVNLDQFKLDMNSAEANNIINADIKAGQNLKVDSTPTFVLEGKKIENPGTIEGFSKLIDAAIKAKK